MSNFYLISAAVSAVFAVICLVAYCARMSNHRALENEWWDKLIENPTRIVAVKEFIKEAATLKKPLLYALTSFSLSLILLSVSFGTMSWIWASVGSGVLAVLLVTFILSAITIIQEKPIYMGVPVQRGRPLLLCKAIKPGYVWLPGDSFGWHSVITEDCTTIDDPEMFTFKPEVRAQDMGLIVVPIGLTLEVDPDNLYTYVRRGGKPNLSNILSGIVKQVVREWAGSRGGPETAEEALFSQEEVTLRLVKKIAGKQLPDVPSIIPTRVLRRMLGFTVGLQSEKDKKEWGEDWGEAWKQVRDHEDEAKIRRVIEARDKKIEEVKSGNGGIRLTKWGVILARLTCEDIQVVGKLADAIADEAVEEYEARGELREMNGVIKRAALLVKHAKDELDIELSLEAAFRIVEIQQGKTSRTYLDLGLPSEEILRSILSLIGGRK